MPPENLKQMIDFERTNTVTLIGTGSEKQQENKCYSTLHMLKKSVWLGVSR